MPNAGAASDVDSHLIATARRIATDDALFPPHSSEVLPGTFAERAEAFVPLLRESAHRVLPWRSAPDFERVKEVISGARPASELPPAWTEELRRTHDAVAGVLRATHARSGQLPSDLQLFSIWSPGPDSGLALEQAMLLAVLDARAQAEAHQGTAAANECLDAIAIARNLGQGYLVSRMLGDSQLPHLVQGCSVVIRSLDGPALTRFRTALEILLASWRPLSWTFEQESVFAQLSGFGFTLDDHLRRQLPEEALRLTHVPETVLPPPSRLGRLRRALFGSWARRRFDQAMRRWCATVDDPRADRAAVLKGLQEDLSLPYRLLGDEGERLEAFGKFAERDLERRSALEGLLGATYAAAYQRRHGRWPSSLADAGFPARWVELTTGGSIELGVRNGHPSVIAGNSDLPLE